MEELKQILEILGGAPETLLWVAGGFLFYKLAMYGSVVGAVVKVFLSGFKLISDIKNAPIRYNIEDKFLMEKETKEHFMRFLNNYLPGAAGGSSYRVRYSDVEFLIEAVKEKKERDK